MVIITLQCYVCMCMLFTQAAQLALASSIIFDKIQIQHNMHKYMSVHFRYTIMYLAHSTNAWCEMINVCKTCLKTRRGRDCAYIYTII